MGMDVSGKAPVNEAGEYLRRSVWGWHPLADYIITQHPDLAVKVEYWHTNDGDGLDAADALELGTRMLRECEDGTAQAYVDQRDAALGRLPLSPCRLCGGTGLRTDEVGVRYGYDHFTMTPDGAWVGGCNGCSGRGTERDWATSFS